ncbi:hypothetical protein HDU76_004659, partial [Blyttiomyces sp. JEL0837]
LSINETQHRCEKTPVNIDGLPPATEPAVVAEDPAIDVEIPLACPGIDDDADDAESKNEEKDDDDEDADADEKKGDDDPLVVVVLLNALLVNVDEEVVGLMVTGLVALNDRMADWTDILLGDIVRPAALDEGILQLALLTAETAVLKEDPQHMASVDVVRGNTRAKGTDNPSYTETYSFTNDFAALQSGEDSTTTNTTTTTTNTTESIQDQLFKAAPVRGICKVICFSPKHNLTVAEMEVHDIVKIVDEWVRINLEIQKTPWIRYVQVFENKGAIMGCSNPHPHGQVWATESIPEEPHKECQAMSHYRQTNGPHSCLLCDYIRLEQSTPGTPRLVCENTHFIALVPFWAVWPFEVLVLPKQHVSSIVEFDESRRLSFADILRRVTCRYDGLFRCSFPYSMGLHGVPVNSDDEEVENGFHFHAHFYPPLLRSASVKKFLVGFEMLGEPQRDLTPEQAAERLRYCEEVHYSKKG